VPSITTPCIVCDEPMRVFPTSAGPGKMTHKACKQVMLEPLSSKPVYCAHCREAFESKRRAASRGGRWIRCCSKSCARKLEIFKGTHSWGGHINTPLDPAERAARAFERGENARRKRRARLAGVKREPYTTASIAERDGYLCSLCGERVDVDLKYPHPGSASVDHILPLSLGGDDTLANVALACLGCNLRKSNRV
jgi:5-methylcytosine-specific restriction endonuclease McrA